MGRAPPGSSAPSSTAARSYPAPLQGYPTASTMGPLRAHRRPGTPPPLRMDRHVARPGASPCRRLAIGLDAGARALMLADRELAH